MPLCLRYQFTSPVFKSFSCCEWKFCYGDIAFQYLHVGIFSKIANKHDPVYASHSDNFSLLKIFSRVQCSLKLIFFIGNLNFFIGGKELSFSKYALRNLGKAWRDNCFKETSLNLWKTNSFLTA